MLMPVFLSPPPTLFLQCGLVVKMINLNHNLPFALQFYFVFKHFFNSLLHGHHPLDGHRNHHLTEKEELCPNSIFLHTDANEQENLLREHSQVGQILFQVGSSHCYSCSHNR